MVASLMPRVAATRCSVVSIDALVVYPATADARETRLAAFGEKLGVLKHPNVVGRDGKRNALVGQVAEQGERRERAPFVFFVEGKNLGSNWVATRVLLTVHHRLRRSLYGGREDVNALPGTSYFLFLHLGQDAPIGKCRDVIRDSRQAHRSVEDVHQFRG